MMPIKIQCGCGQKYAFDVEPVNGRMAIAVACPVCGADGTAAADAVIGQTLAAQPETVPVAGARFRTATPTATPTKSSVIRRPAIIGLLIISLLIQPVSMIFAVAAYTSGNYPPVHYSLYLLSLLFANISVLFISRSAWRWLMLLIIIPYILFLHYGINILGNTWGAIQWHTW
jgi:hypothetical protein